MKEVECERGRKCELNLCGVTKMKTRTEVSLEYSKLHFISLFHFLPTLKVW